MTYQWLQKEIISCIWSSELKASIEEKGHAFSEKELLGIAFHFARSFEERLRLLQMLVDYAPSVADHAARCITWQKKCLEQFCRLGAHEIYELRIKNEPDAYEERYLCGSFDTALEMIDKFYREYDFETETEKSHYVIEKRKILQSGQPFCEDRIGECVFSAGKVLVSVESMSDENENGKCSHVCIGCSNPCVLTMEVCFPAFISDRSPVRYRLPDGSLHYGIHLSFQGEDVLEYCYIIPLDGGMLKNRSYDKDWGSHWHEHIPWPFVESVLVTALEDELQENYHAFVAWLDDNLRKRCLVGN